jgi:poly-gamma-glutamate capsule biosynthesis protein CapA/YwtB (metallophosphatase superfamily)
VNRKHDKHYHSSRARRRRREGRIYVLTAVFASLCVFALVWMIITIRDSSRTANSGTWIVEDGNVAIAAPPAENGAVLLVTPEPSATEEAPVAVTTEPTEEPTEEPTPELTPEPTESPTPKPTPISIPTDMADISDEEIDEDTEFSVTEIVWTAEVNSAATPAPTPEPAAPTAAPSSTAAPAASAAPKIATPAPEILREPSTITITAAGDCTLGGDYNSDGHERFDKYVDEYGYDYFLKNVKSLFEDDDVTFVNLEGPLTKSTKARRGRIFNFKGDPEYAQILSGSSVEVAGLANNHSMDFSTKGLKHTAKSLVAAGVGPCGYKNVWTTQVDGYKVTCMSVTEWDYTTSELKEMVSAQRAECDLLIVMIHWGDELLYKASDSQIKYGHALIDAGADLVLGSHSHVVGGLESYNGKYIVYGLGNFCFGGNYDPTDYDCMIFRQTFVMSASGADDGGIAIIPCSVSSSSKTNNYQPTPLTGNDAARVIKKVARLSKGKVDPDAIKWDPIMDDYIPQQEIAEDVQEDVAAE